MDLARPCMGFGPSGLRLLEALEFYALSVQVRSLVVDFGLADRDPLGLLAEVGLLLL